MANDGSKPSGNADLGPSVTGLTEGRKLFNNHYTLIKIVGHGASSVVWLAWDEKDQRDVALKFLPEMSTPDTSALALLKREIKKAQELKHPVLVPVYDIEEEGPLIAIATEYVEGATLAEMRAQKSNQIFAPADLGESIKQLCSALEYGHNEAGQAHGGLNPSNLMVSQKGAFRVTDYGLTRPTNDYVAKAVSKPTKKDLCYLSPQQAHGEAATALDDIYSFGATIYELLTSKAPFYTGDIMLQVQQKIPPPMTHRRKELRVIGEPIPRVWEETVAACLAKNPASRPQSISQVRELLGIEADAPAAAAAPAAAPPPPTGPSAKVKIIAVAGLAIVIFALLGVVLGKKEADKPGPNGISPAEKARMKAERDEAVKKAAKEAEEKGRKDSEAKLKSSEAKIKEAELQAEKIRQQMAKDKQRMEQEKAEEAKRVEAAEKNRLEMEAKYKKAQEDAEKAQRLANSKDANEKSKEAETRLKAAETERLRLLKEIEDAKALETKRKVEQAKAEEAAQKNLMAAAERAKQLQAELEKVKMTPKVDPEAEKRAAAELARIRAEQEARRLEEQRKAAEEKAKADEEAKQMAILSEKAKKQIEQKRTADAEARKFKPGAKQWDNSLGMRFVQVGSLMVCVWETRVDDFQAFQTATRWDAGLGWKSPGFKQTASHPVVNVSCDDARSFCKWLTDKERAEGLFATGSYRLPTDLEWSQMAQMEKEEGATPSDRDMKVRGVYPWGNAWPPPIGAGNYTDTISFDPFDETAPVGSFRANAFGLFDLGGNVWEWCDEWTDASQKNKTLRGGSWRGYIPGSLLSSYRRALPSNERQNDAGFRVILDPSR